MKRLLTTTTLMTLVFVSPLILAHDDWTAQVGQRIEETKTRLSLKLSDAQLDQLTPVPEERIEAQWGILSGYAFDLESRSDLAGRLRPRQTLAMSQDFKVVRGDTLGALDGILNGEQLKHLAFKRKQEERQAEMVERIRGGRW